MFCSSISSTNRDNTVDTETRTAGTQVPFQTSTNPFKESTMILPTSGGNIAVAAEQSNSASNVINHGDFHQSNSAPVELEGFGGFGGLGGAHNIAVGAEQHNTASNIINHGDFSQSNSAPVELEGFSGFGGFGAHNIAVAALQTNHADNVINHGDFSQHNSAPVEIGGFDPWW